MKCDPDVLRTVPLFALLDDDETAILAAQVEIKTFAPRERIYKKGDAGGQAYVMVSGKVRVTTLDEDQQEVIVDEPGRGEFFGFASMLEQTPHHTNAISLEETTCIEVSRDDIAVLLERKPHAGMDLLTALGRQFHAAQELVRTRVTRNPNELIESEETFGERIADGVARFGGSWTFIISFGVIMIVYASVNIILKGKAWDPLSVHFAEPVPLHARGDPSPGHHDEARTGRTPRTGLRGELDFDVNRRAASDIQGLARKLNLLDEKMDDVNGLLARDRNAR